MSTTEQEMTLATIAAQLAELRRENERTQLENHRLRERVAALELGPEEAPRLSIVPATAQEPSGLDGGSPDTVARSSRRMLLRRAAGAAVATVAAGALLDRTTGSAEANHGGTGTANVEGVDCHYVNARQPADGMAVNATTTSATYPAIQGWNLGSGVGVRGTSHGGTGIFGTGVIGVKGFSNTANTTAVHGDHHGGGAGVVGDATSGAWPGVLGRNNDASGVGVKGAGANGVVGESSSADYAATYGNHKGAGYGVVGDTTSGSTTSGVLGRHRGAGPGVKGESVNRNGTGVLGTGANGVVGESSASGYAANYGNHKGEGYGVVGDVTGSLGTSGGVLGRNYGTGVAVWGQSVSNNGDGVLGEGKNGVHGRCAATTGNGVHGESTGTATGVAGTSRSGYGGYFRGGRAHLMLVPGAIAGRPTTGAHSKGELYMDSTATLWVCTVSGTPGTWKKVLLG